MGALGNLLGGGESSHSNVADIGEQFDPTSYITKAVGLKWANPHRYLKPVTSSVNKYVGKITSPVGKFERKINPVSRYLDNNVPIIRSWNETVEHRPADAAAIAAALFFSGGALAGMGGAGMGGAGLAGAPAASTAGGMGGLGTSGAAAITPAFSSVPIASGLGGSGLGTLGSAGTAAINSAIPASFSGYGGASGLLSGLTLTDKIRLSKQLADLLLRDSTPQQYYDNNDYYTG